MEAVSPRNIRSKQTSLFLEDLLYGGRTVALDGESWYTLGVVPARRQFSERPGRKLASDALNDMGVTGFDGERPRSEREPRSAVSLNSGKTTTANNNNLALAA